jgi:hypothetical protein
MPIIFCGFSGPSSIDRAGEIGQGRGKALMTLFGEVSGWAKASRLTEGLIDARIVH